MGVNMVRNKSHESWKVIRIALVLCIVACFIIIDGVHAQTKNLYQMKLARLISKERRLYETFTVEIKPPQTNASHVLLYRIYYGRYPHGVVLPNEDGWRGYEGYIETRKLFNRLWLPPGDWCISATAVYETGESVFCPEGMVYIDDEPPSKKRPPKPDKRS